MIDSRPSVRPGAVYRRHSCTPCKYRFTTFEVYEEGLEEIRSLIRTAKSIVPRLTSLIEEIRLLSERADLAVIAKLFDRDTANEDGQKESSGC